MGSSPGAAPHEAGGAAGNDNRRGHLLGEGCEGGFAMLMANRADRRPLNRRISKALLGAVKTKGR